jgi:hypothetical protein
MICYDNFGIYRNVKEVHKSRLFENKASRIFLDLENIKWRIGVVAQKRT